VLVSYRFDDLHPRNGQGRLPVSRTERQHRMTAAVARRPRQNGMDVFGQTSDRRLASIGRQRAP
jgi:hypothetical protein